MISDCDVASTLNSLNSVKPSCVGKKKMYKRRHGVSGYNSETSLRHECHLLYFTLMALVMAFVLPSASIKTYRVVKSFFTSFDKPLTMREYLIKEILTLVCGVKCSLHFFYLTLCSRSFRGRIAAFVRKVYGWVCCSCCCARDAAITTSISLEETPDSGKTTDNFTSGKQPSCSGLDTGKAQKSARGKDLVVTAKAGTSRLNLQARDAAVV